jgi:hypothetical protein
MRLTALAALANGCARICPAASRTEISVTAIQTVPMDQMSTIALAASIHSNVQTVSATLSTSDATASMIAVTTLMK